MSINNDFNINVDYTKLFADTETDNLEEAAISAVIEEGAEQVKDNLLSVKPNLTIEGHVNRLLEQLDMKLTLTDQIDALEDELDELREKIDDTEKELKKLKTDKKSLEIQDITFIQDQERKIQIVRSALKQVESKLQELEIQKEGLQERIEEYTGAIQDQEEALLATINVEVGCDVLDREDLPLLLSHDRIVSYLRKEERLEKIVHAKKMMIAMLENRKSFLMEKKLF